MFATCLHTFTSPAYGQCIALLDNAMDLFKLGSWHLTSILLILSLPVSAANLVLKADTLASWNAYISKAQSATAGRPELDRAPDDVSIHIRPASGTGTVPVPEGLIHDWVGSAFVPNVTIAQLLTVLRDYDHYKDIYSPAVVQSRTIRVDGDQQAFSMEWFRKVANIAAGIDADYVSSETLLSSERGYSVTRSTRIQEVRKFGHADEQRLPPDTGSGFIWRLCSILQFQKTDKGVYLQLEAIVLSREIPHGVRWIADPIVNKLSKNSVAITLTQTRKAVQTEAAQAGIITLAEAR